MARLMEATGYGNLTYSTNSHVLTPEETLILRKLLKDWKRLRGNYGPELFVAAEKKEHKTLQSVSDPDERWPAWLYTDFPAYRKRPRTFPIIVGDDYA